MGTRLRVQVGVPECVRVELEAGFGYSARVMLVLVEQVPVLELVLVVAWRP